MTGSSKSFNMSDNETVYNLVVNGTLTINDTNGNNSQIRVYGDTFTMDGDATLTSTSIEQLKLYTAGGTYTLSAPSTNIANLEKLILQNSSGTISLPELTTKKIVLNSSGGTTQATGDHTITDTLEVSSGTTFNANGNTIACKYVDVNGGTLNLSNSTLNFSVTSDGDGFDMDSGSTLTTGNTTITGYSSATKTPTYLPSSAGFEVVGDVKWLKMQEDADLTVIGAVVDCLLNHSTANIRQWHHTLDTQQLLDADSAGDDDLRLTKPALDNAHELMTG